jgi:hypothetical protein
MINDFGHLVLWNKLPRGPQMKNGMKVKIKVTFIETVSFPNQSKLKVYV